MRPGKAENGTRRATILKSMCRIPTIGPIRADRLLNDFGEDFLASMLIDNVSEFINLMDAKGNFIFSDRQAKRMERAMANIEFGFGEGGYQPTEFIKRYLPDGYFDLLVVDEGHEYKNSGSAQGQAMGVLAAKARKCVLLTGTLMGGYADDLFYLLFRILTRRMIEDGYRPNARGSMAPAAMSFMRDHGVLKDIYTERDNESHKTAKGKKLSVRTVKAPGFGPKGIHRFVLPFTVFLKLKDIGGNVLPAYQEEFIDIGMSAEQASAYQQLAGKLTQELRQALARRDTTLLGVVLNVLLAWPDCCFRPEIVKHPRSKDTLAFVPSIFAEEQRMPKEQALFDLCLAEKAKGRKVLAYTVYSSTRDTTSRLKRLLEQAGLKVAVLRASVDTARREDWILDQVDRGNADTARTTQPGRQITNRSVGLRGYTLLRTTLPSDYAFGTTVMWQTANFGSEVTGYVALGSTLAVTVATPGAVAPSTPKPRCPLAVELGINPSPSIFSSPSLDGISFNPVVPLSILM
jgi:hypothetical protein